MPATLSELAARFGCELDGPGATVIERVAALTSADAKAISFLANPLYRDRLATTSAGAVILDEASRDAFAGAKLVCGNPYATYARIADYLHPAPAPVPGVHPSASVEASAIIAPTAEIGPLVAVGSRARIGDGVVVGAGSAIGADAVIGPGTRLAARVAVLDRVKLGARCIVHSGAVIGSDGYGFAPDGAIWIKVPQLGTVEVGDDVEIGANATIDRGAIEATVIENGVKLDNLVQIAHNVRIGEHTVMAAMCGVAGSTRIGKRCMIAGAVAIIGHLEICDDVMFTVRSLVTKSVSVPGTYGGSLPAEESGRWNKNAARFRKLDTMERRLRSLERAVGQLANTKKDEEHD